MPTDMKALQLFDLGDAAVVELASLYGNDMGGGAGGVSHEELAYLFARSALGRKHVSSALLSETDLARPPNRGLCHRAPGGRFRRVGLSSLPRRHLFAGRVSPAGRAERS
jgi:hypothetical protein